MRHLRLFALAGLVAFAFAAAALLLPHSPQQLREMALAAGLAAPAVALAAWIVLTPALVSGTVLAAAGGLAFGGPGGAALSVAGAVLGGLAAFGLARGIARGQAEAILRERPRLGKLRALLEQRGFQTVLAARLMPGVPSTALHYVAGASPVRTRSFAAAIAIGALLRTTPYAFLGGGVGSGSIATVLVAIASIGIGGVAASLLFRQLRRPAPVAA
ncbi:MAG TPA: VTT domain-containing protein [Solirubrobacterales bacterium]|nr:VTT domain-containing protein [Solirubrobacterales bacterium]